MKVKLKKKGELTPFALVETPFIPRIGETFIREEYADDEVECTVTGVLYYTEPTKEGEEVTDIVVEVKF